MTETTLSKEDIEKVRRDLEVVIALAGKAKADIEQALRLSRHQGEQIATLRRSLGIDVKRVN